MNIGIGLLEKALALGYIELEALVSGEIDKAAELSRQREEAISMAWQQQGAVISEEYGVKLLELQHLQVQLTQEAKKLKQQLAKALNRSHQEGRRLAGYRKVVGYAL